MKWKWPEPPSLRTTRTFNLCLGASCAWLAYLSGPSWTGMINAFLAGVYLSSALHMTRVIGMTGAFNKMAALCTEINELNQALLNNKAVIHVAEMRGDEPPTPRLH